MSPTRSAMTPTRRVLAIVLAGGKGERLHPLTDERSKPAVPFGGKYRIVDFVLSNLVNSGVLSTYVLVQYMSQSLIDHLRANWRTAGLTREHFITVVPPQMRLGTMWYRGTADAVRQNLNLIHDFDPDLVAIFGADHIYRMDIGQMIQWHVEKRADVTVSAIPVPLSLSSSYGIVTTSADERISDFTEKPARAKPMPERPSHVYASMGNYLFTREVLTDLLKRRFKAQTDLDFGKDILPAILSSHRVFAYDFSTNTLPGLKPHEERAYWRDVGTPTAFYEANMDILGARPRLNLNNRRWFIHSGRYDGPPAKVINGRLNNCILSDGCLVRGATIRNSIIGRGVHVLDGAHVEDSVVMDFCSIGRGARIRKTVIDRFNDIPPKALIGFHRAQDSARYFVDPSGLVIVPRGETVPRKNS